MINFEPCIEGFKQGYLFSALLFLDYVRLCNQQPVSFDQFMLKW